MIYELEINKNKVDLSEETMTFEYQSNILGDIDKINQSYSYTIKLPPTEVNRKILDLPDVVSYNSNFPRVYNDAILYKNGLIKAKGYVYLISTSGDYEISFVFGYLNNLTKLVKNSGNLNTEFENDVLLRWDKFSPVATTSPLDVALSYGYSPYYSTNSYEFNNELDQSVISGNPLYYYPNGIAQLHPFVGAVHILQKIEQKYGIDFIFNDSSFIERIAIHCNTQQDSAENKGQLKLESTDTEDLGTSGVFSAFPSQGLNNCMLKTVRKEALTADVLEVKIDGIVRVNINYSFNIEEPWQPGRTFLIYKSFQDWIDGTNAGFLTGTSVQTGDFTYYETKGNIYVDVKKGDELYFVMSTGFSDPSNYNDYKYIINNSISFIEDESQIGELTYPSNFPIYKNLPEMSVIDFIKNVCWLTGTYCSRRVDDNVNVVRFISIEDVVDNKSNAYEWEKYLLSIDNIDYKYRDYAQKNTVKYKENDVVGNPSDLIVGDETIAPQKDMITFGFGELAEIGNGEIIDEVLYSKNIRIPIFDVSVDAEGNEIVTFKAPKAPLLAYATSSRMQFNSANLYPENILKQNYSDLQDVIKKPIVITANFKLNDIELNTLDFEKPVYIDRLGKYYAIISLTDSGNTQKIKLLQL